MASACLYAIEHNFPNMKNDHSNAKFVADSLTNLGIELTKLPETNMVWLRLPPKNKMEDLRIWLDERGFRIPGGNTRECRLVFHLDITRSACEELVNCISQFLKKENAKL